MRSVQDAEEKAENIANPSGYLKAGGWLKGYYGDEAAVTRQPVGRLGAEVAGEADGKVQRRARWLNTNVFPERKIDEEAVAAMCHLSTARAMELFKDLEVMNFIGKALVLQEKQEQIQNPSGLSAALGHWK